MAKIVIPYQDIKSYLIKTYDYTEAEAIHTINKLRRAELPVRRAFATYFTTGELPEQEINGMTVSRLMKYRDMNPFAALLTMDWLGREPERAKWHLTHPTRSKAITRKTEAYIEAIAEQRGWTLTPFSEVEDTSDFIVDDE